MGTKHHMVISADCMHDMQLVLSSVGHMVMAMSTQVTIKICTDSVTRDMNSRCNGPSTSRGQNYSFLNYRKDTLYVKRPRKGFRSLACHCVSVPSGLAHAQWINTSQRYVNCSLVQVFHLWKETFSETLCHMVLWQKCPNKHHLLTYLLHEAKSFLRS